MVQPQTLKSTALIKIHSWTSFWEALSFDCKA